MKKELKSQIEKLNKRKIALQEESKNIDTQLTEIKRDYIKNYFDGSAPKELCLDNDLFIVSPSYKVVEIDGEIIWLAHGKAVLVKDGEPSFQKLVYVSEKEWEDSNFKNRTLKDAILETKPNFPISPAIVNGIDFRRIGYILADNKKAGIQLVFRQGNTSHINKGEGIKNKTELQLLRYNTYIPEEKVKKVLGDVFEENSTLNLLFSDMAKRGSVPIEIGAALDINMWSKHKDLVIDIFGEKTYKNTSDILSVKVNNKLKIV